MNWRKILCIQCLILLIFMIRDSLMHPSPENILGHISKERKVILILVDGVRYDYVKDPSLKGFQRMARKGVKAEYVQPIFPSNSYPNWYTIVTGEWMPFIFLSWPYCNLCQNTRKLDQLLFSYSCITLQCVFCLCFLPLVCRHFISATCKFNAHVAVSAFIVVHLSRVRLIVLHTLVPWEEKKSVLSLVKRNKVYSFLVLFLSSALTSLHLYPKCLLTDLLVRSRASEVHEEMLVCFESLFKILFQDRNELPKCDSKSLSRESVVENRMKVRNSVGRRESRCFKPENGWEIRATDEGLKWEAGETEMRWRVRGREK